MNLFLILPSATSARAQPRRLITPAIRGLLLGLTFGLSGTAAWSASGACFDAAGARYGVSPTLLAAIAWQESGMNPSASHRNANGTSDIGLMQINSSWLPKLARHGVSERDLRDPCVNILVGAWILASNLREMGVSIQGLGAYNARDPVKRVAYARQVLRRYMVLKQPALNPPALPRPALTLPPARDAARISPAQRLPSRPR